MEQPVKIRSQRQLCQRRSSQPPHVSGIVTSTQLTAGDSGGEIPDPVDAVPTSRHIDAPELRADGHLQTGLLEHLASRGLLPGLTGLDRPAGH